MSSSVYIPSSSGGGGFNFQPVSSSRGTTATYTVPEGKYALITVNYDFSFGFTRTGAVDVTVSGLSYSNGGSTAGSFNIWMKAGETIVLAASNTTATQSLLASSGTQTLSITGIAGMNLTINGVLWKNTQSRTSMVGTVNNNNIGTVTFIITPFANFGWYAQEYTAI